MTLKVLHVISDRERRGAQLFAVALSNELCALGHDSAVRALQANRTAGDASSSLLDVEAFGDGRFSIRGVRALRQAMKKVDVTVAHGSTTVLATAMATKGYRKSAGSPAPVSPVVIRQIGDTFAWANSSPKRARLQWAYDRAGGVVALSASAKRVIVDGFDLEADKVVVIPNAVTTQRFQGIDEAERSAARHDLNIRDRCVVAMVGALSIEKGVDVLIDALARTPKTSQVTLIVAGDGPERARLEQQAARLAVDTRFFGSVVDVRPVLAAADLFVLPSRTESMPAALVEAGAAGLACLATNVGSVDEVIEHGRNGLLIEPENAGALMGAIESLIGDPHRRDEMGEAGREMATRFDIGAIAPAWVAALHGVAIRSTAVRR